MSPEAAEQQDAGRCCENTDRHLWPQTSAPDAPYEALFVTAGGGIGINIGGYVIVKPLREWHALANPPKQRPLGEPTPLSSNLEMQRFVCGKHVMGQSQDNCPWCVIERLREWDRMFGAWVKHQAALPSDVPLWPNPEWSQDVAMVAHALAKQVETTPNRGKVIECPWCHGAGGGKLANGDVHDCDLCNGDGGIRVFPMACDAEHPPQQVKTGTEQK